MGKLDGKVALVSGTGGGQGRAAALLFAREGAHVVGCDLDVESAAETASLVRDAGWSMESVAPVDLANAVEAERWVSKAGERHGRIDVLYNNAGGARWRWVEELTPEDWAYGMRNMLDVVYYPTHFAWPYLIASGAGVIINTALAGATTQGFADHPNLIGRTAKAAVIAMTRQLAAEGARHGIRANSLSPGTILVPLNERIYEDPEARRKKEDSLALGRIGRSKEVAACALFLASDDSSYVTGADLVVDGGMSSIRTGPRALDHI